MKYFCIFVIILSEIINWKNRQPEKMDMPPLTKKRKSHSAAHSICNLRYKTLNEIPIVLNNVWNYDYQK